MWFNNIIVYQMAEPIQNNAEEIEAALEEHRLKPCPPHARQSQGWVNPFNDIEGKRYSIFGCHILVAAKELRLLPSTIINAVLEEKMNAFELEHNRPMRRTESMQLKEDIEFDLLPKAFTVLKKDWLYIDDAKQWIVINGANQNKASELITQLTKTLGPLTAAPLSLDANLNELFSTWLREPLSIPEGLSLQQNCLLINGKNDKSQYSCKDIEQNNEELIALLEQGYTVSSIELAWLDRIQFTLTDNFMLKRVKCIDYLDDAFKDNAKLEGVQEQFDANFSLLAGEVRDLLTFLIGSCHKKDAASVVGSESPIYNAPSSTAFTSIV